MPDIDPSELDRSVESFIVDMTLARAIAQGGVDTTVETESGPVDSLAKTVNNMKVSFEAGVGGIFDTVVGGYAAAAAAAKDEANSSATLAQEAAGLADELGQAAGTHAAAASEAAAAAAGFEAQADQARLDASSAADDASTQASLSLSKAAEASASAGQAALAQVGAELARDQSYAGSSARPSVAIALADATIAVGASFTAPLADGSIQAYTKTSTVVAAPFGAPIASKAAVDAQKLENNGIYPSFPIAPYAWGVGDLDGGLALGVGPDGRVLLPGGLDQLAVGGDLIRDCLPPWRHAVCDLDGYVCWGIRSDGSIYPDNSRSSSPAEFLGMLALVIYGQSLSMGGPLLPSTVPLGTETLRALMPNTGTKTYNTTPTSLVTMQESASETACSALAHGFTKGVSREVGFENKKVFAFTAGVSGYSMEALAPGTPPFNQMIDVIRLGKQQADVLGLPYNICGHIYIQGETNALNGTPLDTYRLGLRAMQASVDEYCKAITGTIASVPMFIDQLSSHPYYAGTVDHPSYEIALAQLSASLEGDKIQLVTPMYMFPYADNVHLTNHGYRWMAGYFTKSVLHWMLTGKPWRPVHPILARKVNATTFDVEFSVPKPPLAFDTSIVSQLADGKHGFEIWNNGVRLPVASVALKGATAVRVVSSMAVLDGDQTYVAYALTADVRGTNDGAGHFPSYLSGPTTGARGTLRDSDPALSDLTDAAGNAYRLNNYCVTFRQLVE